MQKGSIAAAAAARSISRAEFQLSSSHVPAETATERQLLEIWEGSLDVSGLGVADDYFELGGDSASAVPLFAEIELRFGHIMPLSSLLDCPTVRSLAARLDGLCEAAVRHPLVPMRTAGDRPPLFIVHGGGASVMFVRSLLPWLGPDQPLFGIEARGLVDGEAPHASFEAMAADYLTAVRQEQPAGPYYLGGYCIGALTAFEMARQLQNAGEKVAFVGLFDLNTHPNEAPWLYWRQPNRLRIRLLRQFILRVGQARRQLRRLRGQRLAALMSWPEASPEMRPA